MNNTPQAVCLPAAEQPAPARTGLASWPPQPVKARSKTTPAATADARPPRLETQIRTPSQSAAYQASLMSHGDMASQRRISLALLIVACVVEVLFGALWLAVAIFVFAV